MLLRLLLPACLLTAVLASTWILRLQPNHAPLDGTTPWDLSRFTPDGPARTVQGIKANLSGITYHPPSGLLYAVTNRPPAVHVLTKDGTLVRSIRLAGFRDTESISHVRDDSFVVAEEQRHNLTLIRLPEDVDTVHHHDAKIVNLAPENRRNLGLEGVMWSERHGLVAAFEYPARLVQPHPDAVGPPLESPSLKVDDFAGLARIPGEPDKLIVLSQASHSLHVVDINGRELSRRTLRHGFLNLRTLLRQPEGVTLDQQGNLYLVGEPAQFLVLRPPASLQTAPQRPPQ